MSEQKVNMKDFMKGNWVYWRDNDGSYTINSEEQLIASTFSPKDFPSVKMTPEEQAQEEAESEAIARAISFLPKMYRALQELVPILEEAGKLGAAYAVKRLMDRIDGEGEGEGEGGQEA